METKENEQIVDETTWIELEAKTLQENNFDGERLPALEFPENKVITFTVDYSKPFQEWVDKESQVKKKIIPVVHDGTKFVIWLNVKNPLYGKLVMRGAKGQKEYKVMRTGQKQMTRYAIIEE